MGYVSGVHHELTELAEEFGVATEFWDWRGERNLIAEDTLRAVLGALGVDVTDATSAREALRHRRDDGWRRVVPTYVTARAGRPATVELHVPDGVTPVIELELEDGSRQALLAEPLLEPGPRTIDGTTVRAFGVALGGDLPPGYHRLHAAVGDADHVGEVLVAPAFLGMPERVGRRRGWGLAAQLYSVRSHSSWGVGDLADLSDLAAWAGGRHDASFVLINPLHAAEPVPPLDPSPYLPTSRRFANPLYLRVEGVAEYATLDAADRAAVAGLRAGTDNASDQIDRDTSWQAKRAALEIVHRAGRSAGRQLAFEAYCRREGVALDRFAAWCALVEEHGADWHRWPEPLRHPDSDAVADFAARHRDTLDFHRWLQWQLDEQLESAHATARRCGMALGVMHDLAVGVSTVGADSWSYQDELARGISVGAPPDAYAQTGQDWEQPPWRPDRLAALGYAPIREQFRSVLRHAGGIRVDHILGLFRLWWIPQGADATAGTYVHYDHDAFVATLMIEAQRAGAVVVGEDLGTVEPWVRDYLAERGVLGTSVLWFERDWEGDGEPTPPEQWRAYCLASVTTHDLPPTPAYLAGDHVRLRHELGLLTRPLDEELAADRADQQAWLDLLRDRGELAPDADEAATVEALHRALLDSPARLRCVALTDAVGERRTQNQPGTRDGYPNWRIPLGGPDGEPVFLEDVFSSDRAAALVDLMREPPPVSEAAAEPSR
jgi:4-alpha-glucanotransferase